MEHTKGVMTVKEYGGRDSLYIDRKCWASGVSKEISHRLALCWNSHDTLTRQRDELLKACRDLINANAYARRVSLRDEAPRGSVWGEARSTLDAAKLKAQKVIHKIEAKAAIAAVKKKK